MTRLTWLPSSILAEFQQLNTDPLSLLYKLGTLITEKLISCGCTEEPTSGKTMIWWFWWFCEWRRKKVTIVLTKAALFSTELKNSLWSGVSNFEILNSQRNWLLRWISVVHHDSDHLYGQMKLCIKKCLLKKHLFSISSPNMQHFNQAPWEMMRLYCINKKFFVLFFPHSGHMHGVHRNACLTYLFIPSNIPVAKAQRHKDISKHKPRPAKSWVVRLISKRQQCRAEAKDPILVITLPLPPLPLQRLQTLMLCQALWTSVFSELKSVLHLRAFCYSGCVLTAGQVMVTCLIRFSDLFSHAPTQRVEVDLSCSSIWPAVNIPLWFSASGPVHCGGFPCQINIARVIHWHHPFSQLGPGKVPTITLYLWYS